VNGLNTRRIWISIIGLVALSVTFAQVLVDHYKEGQRLFGEQKYAEALKEFQEADALVPDDPAINSWIGATYNVLGKYAEAKQRLQTAFKLLEDQQKILASQNQPVPPIDLTYYALLANVQASLGEYEPAVQTILSYKIPDGVEDPKKAQQAVDAAKKGLYDKIVAAGVKCMDAKNVECLKSTFKQADLLDPAPPSAVEAIATEALKKAARAPATTDPEKAEKAGLYKSALEVGRMWAQADPTNLEAQRYMAKASMGMKSKEGYEEAARILTSLWNGCDEKQRDAQVQIDLASAYAGLEDWNAVLTASSTAIETDSSNSEGYCKRSYAQYRLNKCEEAIEDGQHCKTPDGKPQPHVKACTDRLAQQAAQVAAQQNASTQHDCDAVQRNVEWALESAGQVALEDLINVIQDFKAAKDKCASHFKSPVGPNSGAELCDAGVQSASYPLNLSSRSKAELEKLKKQIEEFHAICKPNLDDTQIAGVQGGISKIDQALSMSR
jgi:tetratricopeptide (TPR) repeat protein